MNTAPTRNLHCPSCGSLRDPSLPDALCACCLLDAALSSENIEEISPDDEHPAGTFTRRRIGRYWLTGEIARGGAGIVYRAWQDDLGREVALKMLAQERLETKEARERFRREAELMAGLDHPGILPVYEVGEHEGLPYYSMKLAEGGNLAQRIAALHGRHREIAELLASIARAVAYGHERGVLHRDLKPSNIVIDAAGRCLLTDFGLARRMRVDSTLTGVDALIGTPRYVAPEVLTTVGADLTAAADVYGLGAILYELLTGQAPFSELTPLQILQQVATRRPTAPRRIDAKIPAELETICLRCLEKRPGDRYPSAAAFAAALERWQRGSPSRLGRRLQALTQGALPSRRRAWAWGALASLIVVAVAATLVFEHYAEYWSTPDPRIATRTLAVLPADLPHPSPAELAAARTLSSKLQGIRALDVLPFDAVLRQAQERDFPQSAVQRGGKLGAFVQVKVRVGSAGPSLRARAVDGLRQEILWQGAAASVGDLVERLRPVLESRRRHPPPEAQVPREALAADLRGAELFVRFESGANDAAIEAFQQAIAADPKFALAHVDLSAAYTQRAKRFGGAAFWNDTAIQEAERAINLDPSLPAGWDSLALAYYYRGWLKRATATYRHAGALGAPADRMLALLAYGSGHFDESFRLIHKDQEFSARGADGFYWIAQPLIAAGEIDAGERWMRIAIAAEDDADKRQLMEAEIARYRGDFTRCRKLAEPLDPDLVSGGTASANDYARICAEQQHDWAGALALLQHEIRHYAQGTGDLYLDDPLLEQAVLFRQLGRNAEAAPLIAAARRKEQAAIDGGQEHFGPYLRMAAILRLEGDQDGAYRMLDTATAHGLTSNARTDGYYEFLPFHGDARFAAWQKASRAEVATRRQRIEAMLKQPDYQAFAKEVEKQNL
jgi:tRNA A-37 threonylcarbamoyl transferase component Bud32